MDADFMTQVKDRVAKATESVASYYDPSALDDLPEIPTLPELLVELASDATHRCGECGAVLIDGSRSRICLACGELQPAATRQPEPFDFNTSLALQLFFDSLKLDGIALGIKKASQATAKQGSGLEKVEKGEPENLSADVKSKLFEEEEEEDIWESAEGETGAVNWTQQLAEASAGDFFSSGVTINNNSSYPTTQHFVESTTDDFDDFFQAAPQPQSRSQSEHHSLKLFQNAPQSKVDLNFPVRDDGLFSLTQNHRAGQTAVSVDSFQDFSQKRSADLPSKPSVLEHQGSSNDFFGQLEELNVSRSQVSQGHDKEPAVVVKTILNELPDLSFMLADHLVVPGGKKKSLSTMWSFKELE